MGQLAGSPAPLSSRGAPTLGVYIMFISVHRSTALPATGRAVFMAEEARGQDLLLPSSAWHQALSLLSGLLTFSSLKSYLRTFGSLAIFTY